MTERDPLFALVADVKMEAVIRWILSRPDALGIRPIQMSAGSVRPHIRRDSGVFREAHDTLRSVVSRYEHALILLDYQGCGREHRNTPEEVGNDLRNRVRNSGWGDRAEVILLVPELEIWMWPHLPIIARALRLEESLVRQRYDDIPKDFLGKPADPKSLWESLAKESKTTNSSALFERLAVTLATPKRIEACQDASLKHLRRTLMNWFPPANNL